MKIMNPLGEDTSIMRTTILPSMLEILTRIVNNEGTMEDLDMLESLSETISQTALCGLGQAACNPVMSTLKYFRNEYIAHIQDKHCPHCNKAPKALKIDAEKCIGCTKCAKNCPVEAITGTLKQAHAIDTAKCIKCYACMKNCPKDAIREE